MKKTPIFLLFVGASIFLFSCHKSEADAAQKLLCASGWKYANFEKRNVVNGVPTSWISSIDTWDSCKRDDISWFKSNGIYEQHEGATTCGVGFPDIFTTGNWTLMSEAKELRVTIGSGNPTNPFVYDITILDRNTLQLTMRGYLTSYPIGGTPANDDHEELRWTYVH